MNIRFFKRIWTFIISPQKAWQEVKEEKDSQDLFSEYLYPLIGFVGLVVLAASIYLNYYAQVAEGAKPSANMLIQNGLIEAAQVFFSFVGGFFLIQWLLIKLFPRMWTIDMDQVPKEDREAGRVRIDWLPKIIGYGLTLPLLAKMANTLCTCFVPQDYYFFVQATILWSFFFYSTIQIWIGSHLLAPITRKGKTSFFIVAAISILVLPQLIDILFTLLTNSFNGIF